MVKKTDIHGGVYHEPPYTWAEQLEIVNRANGGVVAFTRPSPRPTTFDPSDRK
jgi:hypothetical protein